MQLDWKWNIKDSNWCLDGRLGLLVEASPAHQGTGQAVIFTLTYLRGIWSWKHNAIVYISVHSSMTSTPIRIIPLSYLLLAKNMGPVSGTGDLFAPSQFKGENKADATRVGLPAEMILPSSFLLPYWPSELVCWFDFKTSRLQVLDSFWTLTSVWIV